MNTASFLLRLLLPTANAVTLETAGQTHPAIQAMWASICSTLPFCGAGTDAPRLIACKLAQFIFESIAAIGICIVIYAGIQMITGQGDDGKLSEAKKTIAYAGIGIVIAMVAWAVVPFVAMVFASLGDASVFTVVPLQCQ